MSLKFGRFLDNRYEIVEDGLLSDPEMGEGRMIPCLVLKSKKNDTALKELIRIHKEMPPGDVIVSWSRLLQSGKMLLHIQFEKPMEIEFQIEFSIRGHYSLIDAIIQSRGLFVGVGEKGEKISMKVAAGDVVLMEIPDTGIDAMWNKIFRKTLKKKFRKQGVPKKQINKEIQSHINHIREILYLRRDVE